MGKQVWKYTIPGEPLRFAIPKGAKLLHVHAQDEGTCLWAEVDPDAEREWRSFGITATGRDIPSPSVYVGTAHEEPFVWHVYEILDADTAPWLLEEAKAAIDLRGGLDKMTIGEIRDVAVGHDMKASELVSAIEGGTKGPGPCPSGPEGDPGEDGQPGPVYEGPQGPARQRCDPGPPNPDALLTLDDLKKLPDGCLVSVRWGDIPWESRKDTGPFAYIQRGDVYGDVMVFEKNLADGSKGRYIGSLNLTKLGPRPDTEVTLVSYPEYPEYQSKKPDFDEVLDASDGMRLGYWCGVRKVLSMLGKAPAPVKPYFNGQPAFQLASVNDPMGVKGLNVEVVDESAALILKGLLAVDGEVQGYSVHVPGEEGIVVKLKETAETEESEQFEVSQR